MRKKPFLIGGAFVLTVGIAAAFFSGADEKTEPENKAPAVTEKEEAYPENDEIPKHSDNEEDLQPEIMQQTKQLAQEFVTLIAPLDPEGGADKLEKLKPIVSEELFNELSQYPARPTLTVYKRELLNIQTFPVDDILPDRKKWNVVAVVETSDSAGKAQKEEIWYWVSTAKRAGEWKVTGYEEGE